MMVRCVYSTWLLCLVAVGFVLGQEAGGETQTQTPAEPLPAPIATENSLELCLNSRYSEHNLSGTADRQQIGHVLWAVGRMPILGAYRHVWVATPTGTFLYDPARHALIPKRADGIAGAAFAITYEAELAFDAGVAYMPAILASISLWGGDGVSIASCPQGTQLRFGVQQVKGVTSEIVAHSSVQARDPCWLPDPFITGCNRLEQVIDHLRYTSDFTRTPLTPGQTSQILWAGYGCTPHTTYKGKAGLTVPSAYADYYLAGAIYLANERGVYRYLNRNPDNDPATRDHRIEQIGSADVRQLLRDAVEDLPEAPCGIVLCLQDVHAEELYAQLEVGFVAANMLMQASAMDLGCCFNVRLSVRERQHIQAAMGIPGNHLPQAIVNVGPVARTARSEVHLRLTFLSHNHDANSPAELTVQFTDQGAIWLKGKPSYEFVFREGPPFTAGVHRLTVADIRPGTYDISVRCDCGLTSVNRAVAVSGASTEVRVAMSPSGG